MARQATTWEPALVKPFINTQALGTPRTPSKSADDGRCVHALFDGAIIQGDLSWLETQTDTNLMQVNKVFHLGRSNPTYQYRLGDNWLEPTEVWRTSST